MQQGTSSQVEEIVHEGRRAVRKRYRARRGRDQELRALSDWATQLRRLSAPRVLGVEPDALVLSWVPGSPPSGSPALLQRLGEGLRELHRLDWIDADPMPLIEALPRRMQGWVSRAGGDPQVQRAAEALPDALASSSLGELRRVPCHRDVAVSNLLEDADGLTLLDYEHAGPDCAYADMLRSWEGLRPSDDPSLAALADGAGLPLVGPGEATLLALGLVEGAGCLVWGRAHDDLALRARGDLLLGRLLRW